MNGSDRNNDKSGTDRSSLPDQLYTTIIIALALFLIALAVFRPPSGDVTVESVLNYTRQNDPGMKVETFRENLRSELTSSKSMERALSGIREDLIPNIKSEGGWGPLTERLAEKIQLSVYPIDGEENLNRIRISSSGPSEAFQWQLVQSLQQQFEDLHNKPVDLMSVRSKFREARDEVASALGILDFTQKRIDDYVEERLTEERVIHEQQLASVIEELERQAVQPDPNLNVQAEPEPELPVIESVNPTWRYLKDEIKRLKRKRNQLANASQDEAAYGSIDNEIMSLEAALATTPKIVSGAPSTIDNPFVKKEAPKPSPTPQPIKKELDLSQLPRFDVDSVRERIRKETDYKRLMARLEEARTTHNKSLDNLKLAANPGEVVSESVAVVQTPTITNRKPGEVSQARLFSLDRKS
ncbi:MAG: hypothetical protein AAF497_03790, partial [Planctomycetota bacterium]